jgi:hypothetical protein
MHKYRRFCKQFINYPEFGFALYKLEHLSPVGPGSPPPSLPPSTPQFPNSEMNPDLIEFGEEPVKIRGLYFTLKIKSTISLVFTLNI